MGFGRPFEESIVAGVTSIIVFFPSSGMVFRGDETTDWDHEPWGFTWKFITP